MDGQSSRVTGSNPIIPMDFPDPDIIRVGKTYYMVSTTMYFMPGCVILRSYDLIHWEYHTRVYDTLEDTPQERLEGDQHAYGKGMWAASLRYHRGEFFITFAAYDTGKTYLYRAPEITGPWKKQTIDGFYHDSSLFFDDDGKCYLVYGAGQIYLTELRSDLSGPAENGLHRVIADSGKTNFLGYEGSHFYKVGGRYYLFVIHSLKDRWRRVESCFSANELAGPFTGGIILNEDLSFFDQGIAQGGIVDTPDHRWYGFFFQDRGACGRVPVLFPMTWKNGMPVVLTDAGCAVSSRSEEPEHIYTALFGSDDFTAPVPKPFWEWNHNPDPAFCCYGGGRYEIINSRLCTNVARAVNTLTQRALYPRCSAAVTVDGSALKDGDAAGMCVLQDHWGTVGLEKENGQYMIVLKTRGAEDPEDGKVIRSVPVTAPMVRVKILLDFSDLRDTAFFFFLDRGVWKPLGDGHPMRFLLTHFTGNRFGLYSYASARTGGHAVFTDFEYLEQ